MRRKKRKGNQSKKKKKFCKGSRKVDRGRNGKISEENTE